MFKKIKAWYLGLSDKTRGRIRFFLDLLSSTLCIFIYIGLVAAVIHILFGLDVTKVGIVIFFLIYFFPFDAVKFFNTFPREHRTDEKKCAIKCDAVKFSAFVDFCEGRLSGEEFEVIMNKSKGSD